MKFVCDVCPSTAADGQTAVIGHYEKWIRHLLSPQHQTEQYLVMSRTSYWPTANWIALVKNLPVHEEATAELFVDIVMSLSEYGFIEAVYYGNKNESLCVALQWYETKTIPESIIGPDYKKYEVKLIPTLKVNFANGLSYDAKSGARRFRYNCVPMPSNCKVEQSELETTTFTSDAATSPVSQPLKESYSDNDGVKIPRIKYDRDALLRLCVQTAMPPRFIEIFQFPRYIVEAEAKLIDLLGMHQQLIARINIDEDMGSNNKNFTKENENGNRFNGNRNKVDRDSRQQRTLVQSASANSQWTRELKPVLKSEEEW